MHWPYLDGLLNDRMRFLGSIDVAGIPGFEPGSKAPEALIIS